MGYEFEDVDLQLIIKNADDFNEFIRKLKDDKGTAQMPDELYIKKDGYAGIVYDENFDINDYPNHAYLKIKHKGCFEWYDIERWLKIFNEYCLGDMDFTGDWGENVFVTFDGKPNYSIAVSELRQIPEKEWNEEFKDHYYEGGEE